MEAPTCECPVRVKDHTSGAVGFTFCGRMPVRFIASIDTRLDPLEGSHAMGIDNLERQVFLCQEHGEQTKSSPRCLEIFEIPEDINWDDWRTDAS